MAAVLPTYPYGRKILVQNIPVKATEDKLWIHFQKKKNGGQGDVSGVLYPKSRTEPNQAIVEFESRETVVNVLQHHQEMFDTEMQVTVYNELAFGFTQAHLSSSAVIALSQGPTPVKEKLKNVASQSGVEVSQQKPYFINGQFDQVRKAYNLIEAQLEQYRLEQSREKQEKSVSSKSLLSSSGSDEKSYQNAAAARINEHVFAYWRNLHAGQLETLKKKYKVDVEISEESIIFKPKENLGAASETINAQRKFVKMYAKFTTCVVHSSVDTTSVVGAEENDLEKGLEIFHKRNRSEYIHKDGATIHVYALSKKEIDVAVKQLQEILMESTKNEEMQVIEMDKTDLKVVVVHGDICKERVSVLVNEGSTSLNEVTTAGGKEMIQEFTREFHLLGRNKHGKLIETSPGWKLQCERVIHYCFNEGAKLDLCDVLDSVSILIKNKLAQTVTLPMHCIGTNIHNAKEEVMNFILKFNSKMISSPHKHIKEIRILHPDKKESKKLAKFFMQLKSEWASNLASSSSGNAKEEPVDDCVICLEELSSSGPKLKKLECNHVFHQSCIDKALNISKRCPSCMRFYGTPEGNQPKDGRMTSRHLNFRLPGFSCDTIEISYYFPNGVQGPEQPHPGVPYRGTTRVAYLPNNPEGREILLLLYKAFERRLVFTVGRSVTTGLDNCVTWNDIHHKTSPHGGASNFGYPDPTYLQRVRQELAEKGITIP